MRANQVFLLTALTAVLLPSCVENHIEVKLNKDGSGMLERKTLLSDDFVKMSRSMAKLAEATAPKGKKKTVPDILEELQGRLVHIKAGFEMGKGVHFEDLKILEAEGQAGALAIYKFDDINTLRINPDGIPVGGGSIEGLSDSGFSGKKKGKEKKKEQKQKGPKEYVTFKLEGDELEIDMGATEGKSGAGPTTAASLTEDDKKAAQVALAMVQPLVKGMHLSLKVTLNDGLGKTDASHTEGDSITLMDFEIGKVLEDEKGKETFNQLVAEKQAGNDSGDLVAQFKGLPGVKREEKNTVTVQLK